ncbi:MAG: VPLPA-CTERM sorting domain-containing protein [Roseobacter sp.]
MENTKVNFFKGIALGAALIFASSVAQAAVITLDFEGLGNQEAVNDFYNGGTGGSGSSGGENFGVSFSGNSLSVIDADAGGTGNFGNEPTPDTILFFLSGAAATLNFAAGFDTGFSFFYTAINVPGSISVYDNVDASGNLLATLDLAVTPSEAGDPTGQFNVFVPIGVGFSGIAKSIDFGGAVNQIGFDNITFGSEDPGDTGGRVDDVVPLPATAWMMLAGIGGLAAAKRRKKAA